MFVAHVAQNVHSNEHIIASVESGGRSRSQHSQLGRSCSMPNVQAFFVRNRLNAELNATGRSTFDKCAAFASNEYSACAMAWWMARAIAGAAYPARAEDDAFWLAFAKRTFRLRDDGQVELDYDPHIALAFSLVDDNTPPPDLILFVVDAQTGILPDDRVPTKRVRIDCDGSAHGIEDEVAAALRTGHVAVDISSTPPGAIVARMLQNLKTAYLADREYLRAALEVLPRHEELRQIEPSGIETRIEH